MGRPGFGANQDRPMKRLFQHPWGWATVAPLLCAVHCAATPILVVFAPSVVPGPTAEWTLLGVTIVIAAAALGSALRAHGQWHPFALIGAGLAVWTLSLAHAFHPIPEDLTTVLATLVVAGGLIWNSRLHCRIAAVPCPACTEAVPDEAPQSLAPGATSKAAAEAR